MAWSAPRTWVDGEVVTHTLMNLHLKDNPDILKITRDDLGRIRGLTSAYVDNLSGTSLTGLSHTGASNTFTAGRHRFMTDALLRVPVGADKYATDGGLKTPGSVWVEGDYLHHVDASRQEWRYLGTVIDAGAGADPGFLWVASLRLRYTDASGVVRECPSSSAQHSDAVALGGSLWVQTNYLWWVRETGAQVYQGHQDINHSDHVDHVDHSDHVDAGSPHTDTGHGDVTPHIDHVDGIHVDHSDHVDVSHVDHTDHTDHTDHSDVTPHGDVAEDYRPETVA